MRSECPLKVRSRIEMGAWRGKQAPLAHPAPPKLCSAKCIYRARTGCDLLLASACRRRKRVKGQHDKATLDKNRHRNKESEISTKHGKHLHSLLQDVGPDVRGWLPLN